MASIRPRSIEIKRNYDEISGNNLDTPKEVGHFSVDSRGHMHIDDRRAMRFYRSRNPEREVLDLRRRLVTDPNSVKYEDEDESYMLNNVLNWIICTNCKHFNNIHFVTTRRSIQTLLCTPYCREESWTIYASKFQDFVYFSEYVDDEEYQQRHRPAKPAHTPVGRSLRKRRLAKRSSKKIEPNNEGNESNENDWRLKFLEYMTVDNPRDARATTPESSLIGKHRIIVENAIHNYKLLIRAEIRTAKRKPKNGDTSAYIGVKIDEGCLDAYAPLSELKLLRLWSQSVATGVKELVCGRQNGGIVHTIETYKVKDIPEIPQNTWLPRNCFGFLHQFLHDLKMFLDNEDTYRKIYKFHFNGGNMIDVVFDSDVPHQVIPGWYVTELRARGLR